MSLHKSRPIGKRYISLWAPPPEPGELNSVMPAEVSMYTTFELTDFWVALRLLGQSLSFAAAQILRGACTFESSVAF